MDRARPLRRLLLLLEFLVLFGLLPLAYRLGAVPLPILPALWLVAAGCLVALLVSPGFERRRLWDARDLGRRLRRAVVPFALAAPPLVALALVVEPGESFRLVAARPLLWLAVVVLYPVLSVYPQGVIYRAFLFHRYRALLPGRRARILASAVAFSFVHVVFDNWLAPALTLGGGLLFAWTYERTGSSLVAAVQHALFGCWVFTVGLGPYFYRGLLGLS